MENSLTMLFKLAILISLLTSLAAGDETLGFIYNGFQSANLTVDGIAEFTSNGLLKLTNNTRQKSGHAFYPNPISFKNSSSNSSAFSFSTTFVFAIHAAEYPTLNGHGIAFVVAPTRGLPGARPSQYLGLFNEANNGNASNHVLAVELDTIQSSEFFDINDNHVGIDINQLKSNISAPAAYYEDRTGQLKNLTLISGKPMQVWVEYNGDQKKIDVTLAPFNSGKPRTPLLSLRYDLSPIFNNAMYVGFSSSTGSVLTNHYVSGWSFKMNGQAQELALSQLPKLPRIGPKRRSKFLTIGLPVILASLILAAVSGVVYVIRRKRKFAEVLEEWELEYGPQRFKYKDLYIATKGFKDKGLLGSGGFGRVYKGVLPSSKQEIAVKRISHESRQGMREFVAEIASRSTDVFAFGAFLLEVACGRRPIEPRAESEDVEILVDWVFGFWCRGGILEARDQNLGSDYVVEELELVLKLGLMCSHSEPTARPSMRQIVQYLEKDTPLPELSSLGISATGLTFTDGEGFDDFAMSYPSTMGLTGSSSIADSLLSGGR
ncbi:hypothetical protein Pint_35374 [Pistacia integerrima]|uniref:Uncharacterized protein n=1 Tax=Pistacia integerrima TaxID=434235 RepID=A0ACC0Y1U1_9ROSI|nr:hypothetical protein Pint_35374 [Pistacia integerrima]